MTVAPRTIVEGESVGVYHCISRCVRRAFLCGMDDYTGKNYEHRRGWIAERLKVLSGLFAVDVFAYAVMLSSPASRATREACREAITCMW